MTTLEEELQLEYYGYDLPQELIAQYPLKERDQARLMVIERQTEKIRHDTFSNLGQYLPKSSCLVLNESKVIPARLFGTKARSGGQVEVFLLKPLADGSFYQVLMRPLRKIKIHDRIVFEGTDLSAVVVNEEKTIIRFNRKNVIKELEDVGHIPLPPYIKRSDDDDDREYYQTVFAKNLGSVASPTAGLHFTESLLKKLTAEGHTFEKVTLHINYATFKPVEESNIIDHKMHEESYQVSKKVYDNIKKAKSEKRPIVAVGTTSCRTLETLAKTTELTALAGLEGHTNLFIYPGYQFKMADILITNFHLPYSTLLMLVYAFGSKNLIAKAYQEAIKEKYRFYSYGDAMLII